MTTHVQRALRLTAGCGVLAALALASGCSRQQQARFDSPATAGQPETYVLPPQEAAGFRTETGAAGPNVPMNTGPVTTDGPGVYGSEQPSDSRDENAPEVDEARGGRTTATPSARSPRTPAVREAIVPDVSEAELPPVENGPYRP